MANYVVSSKSNIVTHGESADLDTLIDASDRTIYIKPREGYVVSEADFEITTPTGVTAVTKTNTTVAYEPGNMVALEVDFDGTVNTITHSTFTLPIAGDAMLYTPVIEGADENVISDVVIELVDINDSGLTTTFTPTADFTDTSGTVSLNEDAEVIPGDPTLVGTYTVVADMDSQLPEVPTLTYTSGVIDYSGMELTLDTTDVTTDDGNITEYTMDLFYTSVNKTQTADQVIFEFAPTSKPLTSTALVIENITNTNKTISAEGGTVTYKVYGTVGCKFDFKVVDSNGTDVLAESEYEIEQTGSFNKGTSHVSIDVNYPSVVAQEDYTLRITEVVDGGVLSEAIEGDSNSNSYFDYTINQYLNPIIRFGMTSQGLSNITGDGETISYTGKTNTNINELKNLNRIDSTFDINWVLTSSSGAFSIAAGKGSFSIDEFVLTEVTDNGSAVSVTNMEVELSNNNMTATITGKGHLLHFGEHTTADGIAEINLDLDNILTRSS